MQKGDGKQTKHDKDRLRAEKSAAYKADDAPRCAAGNNPRKRDRHYALLPRIDNSRSGYAADIAAEADQKRHDGFALQPDLRHRVVKHIRYARHVADVFHKAEHQTDAEHKACHLKGEGNRRHNGAAQKRYKHLRYAEHQKSLCDKSGKFRDYNRKEAHKRKTYQHGKNKAEHNNTDCKRLSPAFARRQFVESAPFKDRFFLTDAGSYKRIDPLEFAASRIEAAVCNMRRNFLYFFENIARNAVFDNPDGFYIFFDKFCRKPHARKSAYALFRKKRG